ncbi:MAG: methylated-DNA--[protein]-cysteine S-methyltransferase [Tannerellaceae bacterium]|jgi:AraC family transcriptional regulator of adaptative response/methylated-DNA-[protein]-cysteine methyltransferase|nr:methylated-DNA--[protein]-cysteine S-methyltransferase [Tannerellaceae bacterium]
MNAEELLGPAGLEYTREALRNSRSTLFNPEYEKKISGSGRLYSSFINIEPMSTGEYRDLSLNHHFTESPFGRILIASTGKGVCHISFADDEDTALAYLRSKFPSARYRRTTDSLQQDALAVFTPGRPAADIRLHVKGTEFQLKVWETLLKIPLGQLATYGDIASRLSNPKAFRAVGTAVGANPVAFLIPCHRVIRSSGELGGYYWGLPCKRSMIAWEASKRT